MMFLISIASALLLTPAVLARPRVVPQDEPLTVKSRVTAFVLTPEGKSSVECWEIDTVSNSMSVQRSDGSTAASHTLFLSSGSDLDGVDILTWPSYSDMWPSPDYDSVRTRGDSFDLSNTYNLFNIQGGLVNFNFNAARFSAAAADDDEDVETHIFSLENGDDWFYFEDTSASSAVDSKSAATYPFHLSTISGRETELMRLRYKSQPKHTLVHKGACSFTGIHTSKGSSQTTDGHAGLTVQVNVGDL